MYSCYTPPFKQTCKCRKWEADNENPDKILTIQDKSGLDAWEVSDRHS